MSHVCYDYEADMIADAVADAMNQNWQNLLEFINGESKPLGMPPTPIEDLMNPDDYVGDAGYFDPLDVPMLRYKCICLITDLMKQGCTCGGE